MQPFLIPYLPVIRELMRQYGVIEAYLFGSAATGKMRDDSDVDFLISFPKDLHYTTYTNNYFNLLHALEDLLKKNVELVASETLSNPYLMESINNNKILLYK
jgi:uncharacterized protein